MSTPGWSTLGIVRGLSVELARAPAVRDHVRAESNGFVLRGEEVSEPARIRLDEEDVAERADRRHHLRVDGDLARPTGVGIGIVAHLAELVHLLEATVGGGAGRQVVRRAIHPEVRLCVRVVIRVDDGNEIAIAVAFGRTLDPVRVLEVARGPARRLVGLAERGVAQAGRCGGGRRRSLVAEVATGEVRRGDLAAGCRCSADPCFRRVRPTAGNPAASSAAAAAAPAGSASRHAAATTAARITRRPPSPIVMHLPLCVPRYFPRRVAGRWPTHDDATRFLRRSSGPETRI